MLFIIHMKDNILLMDIPFSWKFRPAIFASISFTNPKLFIMLHHNYPAKPKCTITHSCRISETLSQTTNQKLNDLCVSQSIRMQIRNINVDVLMHSSAHSLHASLDTFDILRYVHLQLFDLRLVEKNRYFFF